jgi:aquaporin Z
MLEALSAHWPEYLIEGLLLGVFMTCACVVVTIVQHPSSKVAGVIPAPLWRRVLIGTLMGLTAVSLIYSPFGSRSGAHMNPGTTLTFCVLGKVKPWDAAFYVFAQFAGALSGVTFSRLLLGRVVSHESVNYAATRPGRHGRAVAWIAEWVISFGMMFMVLLSSNRQALAPYTGIFAGVLVATYITIEAPVSGMSMNPARTLGSALWARSFGGLWIYFTAPPLGMLCAAGVYVAASGPVYCCKMHHDRGACLFHCEIDRMPRRR